MLHFSRDEYDNRSDKLIAAMKERELDALLLFAPESMYWLTGYDTFGYCFFQCLVFKSDGEMALLTRSADLRQARHTSIIENIVIWKDSATADPVHDLRELLNDLDLLGTTIGVEYATQGLTAANGRTLDDMIVSFAETHDCSDLVHHLRVVKSAEEIAHIHRAAELADLALDAACRTARAGADEAVILSAMQGAVLENGGDYPANPFILGSGADALLCRYKSGRRTLDQDDQLTIEWAGVAAQYHVAMMRTLVIGTPKTEHVGFFEAARDALLSVEEAMVPGNSFGDLFAAHAAVLDAAGLSRHRLNACGYSLGARYAPCWMDGPMFYENNAFEIQPDMSLFAHMIIMDSESETAMCLGQTYLTSNGKPESLSRHVPELIVL